MTNEQIKRLRKTLNLTQAEFGKNLKPKYHYLTISRVEKGKQKAGKRLIRAIEEKYPVLEGRADKSKRKTPGDKLYEINIGF